MTLSEYATNYLLLLVGGNPLPVYVSALKLATSQTKVLLLYSTHQSGSRHTATLAKYLEEAIEQKIGCQVERRDIPAADGHGIRERLEELVMEFPHQATVGINYTGGTKQMVIHSLRVLDKKYGHGLVKSYLNAQDKQMYIDKGNAYINPYPVKTGTQIEIDDLLNLHGYRLKPGSTSTRKFFHDDLLDALFAVHQTKTGSQAWYKWRRNEYVRHNELPDVNTYPSLQPVVAAMERICGGNPTPEKIARFLNCKNDQFSSCANWFKGGWFEEWILRTVLPVTGRLGLHSVQTNLIIQHKDDTSKAIAMEVDIVAMNSYQLFAISCIASRSGKGETKKHLFEAYTRARQLGGDEARVALIYLGADKEKLEHEINRDWLVSEAITVFGRNELQNFQNELYGWFRRHI